MTDKEYQEFIEEYGDVSSYIKNEVYNYKSKTTDLMDGVKLLFFVSLLKGKSKKEFKNELNTNFNKYKQKIDKSTEKAYKKVSDAIEYENTSKYTIQDKTALRINLNDLKKQFEVKSSKTQDDKYVRIIENYYNKTKKTTEKPWIKIEDYLTKKVSEYDKVEKTIRYNRIKKDGSNVMFDIASYDSMVYNTNLTNTGIRETIKQAERRGFDVVYVEAHPFSCPMCQQYQGKFYSLTGITKYYKGNYLNTLDSVSFWNTGYGLFHPNCSHVTREAFEDDEINDKYNGEKWVEKYDDKQKINSLELKKKRTRNDMKVYQKLGNQEMVDKNKQQINAINKQIRELR